VSDAGRPIQHPQRPAEEPGWPEATDPAEVAPEAAREVLERVLASPEFDASERNRRFLRYVVEEALAGRGDRIKAYAIATTVFGRDDGFDPQTDPIVRIEASRLRRSLERYYLLAGRDDPIRMHIAKGGYAPTFHRQTAAGTPPAAEPAAAAEPPLPEPRSAFPAGWPRFARPSPRALLPGVAVFAALGLGWLVAVAAGLWPGASAPASDPASRVAAARLGPSILVRPFEDDGVEPAFAALTQGLTREVLGSLTRFGELFVFGPETAFHSRATAGAREPAAEIGVDYLLTGAVSASPVGVRVTASLIEARSGRYLWSGRFEGDPVPAAIIDMRDDLADRVARELAQPYGIIFGDMARRIDGKPPESYASYECVLAFYRYWRTYDAALYGPVRACLERAIVVDPGYATAHASLAIVYADAWRFDHGSGPSASDPLARALELAHHAVELAPNATLGYHALHLVYWLMNDVERSLNAAELGLALNPHDTALMADLGQRYSLTGRWDEGLPLVRMAYARNPAQSGQYRISLFLHHYIEGRHQEALAEARDVDAPGIIYNHIALAMAYGRLGRMREAAAEVDRILAIDPAYGVHVVADLEKRNLHPDLIEAVVDGLESAGLAIARSPTRTGS
jgi:adenylate cyclase